jgi:hypothetical protein
MPGEAVLDHIRKLSQREVGLFRMHRTHSALYARARRQFGSWAAALAAAGIDYREALRQARTRGADKRFPRRPRRAG